MRRWRSKKPAARRRNRRSGLLQSDAPGWSAWRRLFSTRFALSANLALAKLEEYGQSLPRLRGADTPLQETAATRIEKLAAVAENHNFRRRDRAGARRLR